MFGEYKPTESDQKMIDLLTTIWVNIADIGYKLNICILNASEQLNKRIINFRDPTPKLDEIVKTKWLPIQNEDKLLYYFIKSENEAEMVENIYAERASLWERLPLYSKKGNLRIEL